MTEDKNMEDQIPNAPMQKPKGLVGRPKKRYKEPLVTPKKIESVLDRHMPIEDSVQIRNTITRKQALFTEISRLLIDAGGKAPGYHRRLSQILDTYL